jgi:hypothetical protein
MSTSIIIGMGEVGRAVKQVMSKAHQTAGYDSKMSDTMPWVENDEMKVLHVCIPFSLVFDDHVRNYQKLFKPNYTIVHSTVPVGTCNALDVYHSPIRGVFPYLAESLTEFITYLAPKNSELKAYLQQTGMDVKCVADTNTTEAGKLWSLTAYALSILLEKEMYKWCEVNDVDYTIAYKHFTHTYNAGYNALGMSNYTRPILEHMDGLIGGHCVLPGVEKLVETSKLAQMIMDLTYDTAPI